MPKAKKFRGVRLTQSPPPSPIPRRKEDGRPKGTLKKYRFEQTRLGFMLKHEVPAVYEIILRMSPKAPLTEPKVKLIELVCCASKEPLLQTKRFARYLKEYRRVGICCGRAKLLTPQREAYYKKKREKRLEEFIRLNRKEIDRERMRAKQEKISV